MKEGGPCKGPGEDEGTLCGLECLGLVHRVLHEPDHLILLATITQSTSRIWKDDLLDSIIQLYAAKVEPFIRPKAGTTGAAMPGSSMRIMPMSTPSPAASASIPVHAKLALTMPISGEDKPSPTVAEAPDAEECRVPSRLRGGANLGSDADAPCQRSVGSWFAWRSGGRVDRMRSRLFMRGPLRRLRQGPEDFESAQRELSNEPSHAT